MKSSGPPSLLKLCVLLVMFLSYTDTYVFSKPRGGQVVSGAASFTQDGNLTVITAGNRSIINYQSFDIGKNETVQFVQPGAHATVLNRVLTPDPTNIFGHLEANGIVIIANPYGVFFQNGSVINVGGLIAGAGKISDANFTGGKIHFTDLTGDVRNDGVIAADNQIALMGANVVNTGSLNAMHGMAMLVSGPDVYVGSKNGNIFVQANGKAVPAAAAAGAPAASAGSVTNNGTVAAPRVLLGAGDMYSTAIVNSGLLQGRSIVVNGGKNGSATIGGTLDATSAHNSIASGQGGRVDVTAGAVALQGATIDASGTSGGGTVQIGGGYQGGGALAHAQTTTADAATTIHADGTGANAAGGQVVLWSDRATNYQGAITARGGAAAGGQVEVSSHGALGYYGAVDTRAASGATGSLLLDPNNIEITQGGLPIDTTPSIPVDMNAGMTLSISQMALQNSTGTTKLTLEAIRDIRIDDLTANGGTGVLALNGDIQFDANANGGNQGSFVMVNPTANSITDPGHNVTIFAGNAPTTATGTLNSAFPTVAIQTGAISTAATSVLGGAGGNIALHVISQPGQAGTGGNAVSTGNLTSSGVAAVTGSGGDAGTITIDAPATFTNANSAGPVTFTGLYGLAPGAVTTGALRAVGAGTSGTIGVGGAISLTSRGAVSVNNVNTSSPGAAGGAFSILIADGGTPDVVTTNAVTTTGATTGGNVTISHAPGATSLPTAITLAGLTATGASNTTGGIIDLETTGLLTLPTTTPAFTNNATLSAGTTNATTYTTNGNDFTLTLTGQAISLASILDAPRNVVLGGQQVNIDRATFSSTASQTYNAPVTLTSAGATVALTAGTVTNTGSIIFGSTLTDNASGAHGLTLTAGSAGGVTLGNTVGGGGTPLASLTATTRTTGATSTTDEPVTINGVAVTTTGAQSYGPLTLGGTAGALTTLTGTTVGSGTVTGNAHPLTVTAGTSATFAGITGAGALTFNGAGSTALNGPITATSLTINTGIGVAFGGGTVMTSAGQTYGETLVLAGPTTTLSDSGAGAISLGVINSDSSATPRALTISTGGTTTFGGTVGGGGTPLASLTAGLAGAGNLGGTTRINTANLTTSGAGGQVYNDAVTLGSATGATTLAAGTGPVTFANTLASVGTTTAQALTITTTGTTTFSGQVGGTPNVATTAPALASLSALSGPVTINGVGVTTTGSQNYGALTLGGAAGALTTLSSTATSGTAAITATSVTGAGHPLTVDVDSATGTSNFGGISGAGALNFNVAGTATFTGAITATSLTIGTGAGTAFSGGTVTTSAGQSYGETLTLGSATTTLSDSGGGNIGLLAVNSDAVATPRALTISTGGTTTLGGVIGATPLSNLTVGLAGAANLGGTARLNTTAVTTTVAQTYNDKVVLGANATLASTGNGAIAFALTLDNDAVTPHTLALDTGGTTSFGGAVGTVPLASLTTDIGGTTQINGGGVKTTGAQTYNDNVTLGADAVLTAGSLVLGPGITIDGSGSHFALTLTIGSALTLSAGTSTGQAAGRALGILNNIGNFVSNGGFSVGINGEFETFGSQTFANQVIITGGNREFRSDNNGAISFAAVDSNAAGVFNSLSVFTAGVTTFNGQLGGLNPLGGVLTDVGGSTVFNYGGAGNAVQTVNNGTTATGAQTYNDAVTLTQNTTLQSRPAALATVGGSIAFASTVNGAFALTLDTTGATAFGGAVGGTAPAAPLGSLTIVAGGAGTTLSTNSIRTSGGQTYNSPLVLGVGTTLTTTGTDPNTSAITFNSTIGGAFTLAMVTAGGNTVFGANSTSVPGSLLTGLTTSASGTTIFNDAAFTTNGTQNYQGAAIVQSATRALSLTANTGNIVFGGTLNSTAANSTDLTLLANAAGSSITFNGAVGGGTTAGLATALNSLTVTSPTININGGVVNTSSSNPRGLAGDGVQTYNGNVLLGANTTFVGKTITSTGTLSVNAQNNDLTLTLSSLVTVPIVGGFTNLKNFTSNGAGGTNIAGSFTTSGFQHYDNATTVGAAATIGAGVVAGQDSIRFGSTLSSPGAFVLTLATSGPITFSGPVGGAVLGVPSPLGGLITTGTGTANINGGLVTTTGNQSYAGPVVLGVAGGGTTSLTSTGGGTITFGSTVVGSAAGTQGLITSTSNAVNFNGTVGSAGANVLPLASLTANGTGTTNINGGAVTTTGGGQSYAGPVVINTATTTTLTDTTTGNLTFGATLNNTVAGTTTQTLATGGNVTFGGAVGGTGALGNLTVSSGGTIAVNGTSVRTSGTQTYQNPTVGLFGKVSLGSSDAFTSTGGGAITFASTVDGVAAGAQALAVNTTGNGVFNALVGSLFPLASLTTNAGGQTQFNMAIGTAAAGVNVAGNVTLGDAVLFAATGSTLSHPTVLTTAGSQSYTGGSATQNTALVGSGTLTTTGTLDFGTHDLSVRFGGLITVPGAFINVGNFQSDGAGGTSLNGAFTTTGTQTYSDSVTVAGASTLTSAGNLTFNNPVDGNASLTLSATGAGAQVIFNSGALVGNTTALGAFSSTSVAGTIFGMNAGTAAAGKGGFNAASVTTLGPVVFNETGATTAHPDVLTSGLQSYSTGAVLLDLNTFLTAAGDISFGTSAATAATIDSAPATANALTLSTPGNQTFFGVIGATNALGGLSTGAGPTLFSMTIPAGAPAGVRVSGPVTTVGPVIFNVAGSSPAKPSVLTLANGPQTYGTLMNPLTTAVTLQGTVTVLNSANTEPTAGTFSGGGMITINGNVIAAVAAPEFDVRAGFGTAEFDGSVNTTGDFTPGGANVLFKGNIGTAANPVGNFTVLPNGGGPGMPGLDLNGGLYTTGGLQNYPLATVISANTTLQAGGTVTFGGTLDGNNSLTPYSLAITVNNGTIAFNGVVGGLVPLLSLTTGGANSTTQFNMTLPATATGVGGVNVLNAVTINTSADFETVRPVGAETTPTILSGKTYNGVARNGTQTFNAPVTLGVDTILTDRATPGGIVFNSTANSGLAAARALTVNAVGNETFAGLVGNGQPLASLITDDPAAGAASGQVIFKVAGAAGAPSVKTTGAQTYNDAAMLQAATVLTSTSTGDLTFVSTVDSDGTPRALSLNSAGNEILDQQVGGVSRLLSLTTDDPTVLPTAAGRTIFAFAGSAGSPSVTTTSSQTYNDAALLQATTVLTSTGGSLVFQSAVDSSAAPAFGLVSNTPTVGSFVTFAQTVGGTGPLASLTTNGAGTTQINGGITANPFTITTIGSQEYLQAVTLSNDAALRTLQPGGNIDFGNVAAGNVTSSLDGTHSLAVTAVGTASFEAVGNNAPLLNLTVTAAGTTFAYLPALVLAGKAGVNIAGALTINGPVFFNAAGAGNVVFVNTGVGAAAPTSGQDYFGAFTLAGTATFTDSKNGNVTFHQSVDGSGAANLTASTGGTISFLAAVGAGTPLTSLLTSNLGMTTGRTVLSGGSVQTTGTQTFNDAVFLGVAATTLTSTAGGDIKFALTLDSLTGVARALEVDTAGHTIFSGAVGGTNPLATLTTDYEGAPDLGTQINGGSITTSGAQIYHDDVTLGLDTTLTSGSNVVFDRTLNSATPTTPAALTVKAAGQTVFGGTVGNANPLASVTTDMPGTTLLDGGSVVTTGTQTYQDNVTLGVDSTLTSKNAGALVFRGTVDGAFALTLNTGGLTQFNGAVGNAAALTSLTTDNAGAAGELTQFNMPVGPLAGVVVNGPVTISDAVAFSGTGANAAQPTILTLGNANQTFKGPATVSTDTYLVSAAAPAVGGVFTGGGAVLFNSPAGISGGGGLFVRSGVGVTTIAAAINASSVDLGGATANFAGPVNLTGTFSVEPNDVSTAGIVQFGGGIIQSVGAQTYGAFVLTSDAILTSSGGGTITFMGRVDGAHNLTINSTGDEIFDGRIGATDPLTSLTTDSTQLGGRVIFATPGTTALPSVTTTGAQTYNDAALLQADTVLASTGAAGGITFALTVDSAPGNHDALTLNSVGNQVFKSQVGGINPLASLTTDDPAAGLTGGSVIFAIAATPGVTTTGAQTYYDPAILQNNSVFTSLGSGTLTFANTINGAFSLSLNSAGNEVFGAAVGNTAALTSLTTDADAANAGGQVIFGATFGGPITVITSGAQTYHDAALLQKDTSLLSNAGANLTFDQTVAGTSALTLDTNSANPAAPGTITLTGAVGGGGNPLASLTTKTGTVAINGGAVTTFGAQTYGIAATPGAVLLGADTTLASTNSGAISFNATIDSNALATPHALTINTAGVTTFGRAVGNANPLASLTTASGLVALNGGTVTTTGLQSYGGTVTLGADTVLNNTTATAGDGTGIVFNSAVDSDTVATPRTLVLNAVGDEVFGGAVGAIPLASLTTNSAAAGRVIFGLGVSPVSVTTNAFQTYNNAVLLRVNTLLASRSGGDLTFISTIDGTFALALNTAGNEMLNGRIGGGADGALTSFTTDGNSTLVGGNVYFRYVDPNGGPSVTTSGMQAYHDGAVLQTSTVLTSTGTTGKGTLTFGSTLDSGKPLDGGKGTPAYALTLNTPGNEVFNGLIGSKRALGDLTTNFTGSVPGQAVFNAPDDAGNPAVNVVGRVTINDGALFNASTATVQSTDAQLYNGAVTLVGNAVLLSTGNGTITLASTVDGPAALTVTTGNTMTFKDTVGDTTPLASLTAGGGGNIALNAGTVHTSGGQTYNGPVTFKGGVRTFLTSDGVDGINFNGTVTSAAGLTLTTVGDGATTFALPVNVDSLTATDGSNVTIDGGSVTTNGIQIYGGKVAINGADTTTLAANNPLNVDNGTIGGNIIFRQAVTAAGGGSLLVQAKRILAAADIDVANGGDLDLEASDLLVLAGNNYFSDAGAVRLNTSVALPANNSRTGPTIVVANPGATTRFRGRSFAMGYLQNLFAEGSVSITALAGGAGGGVLLSDIAAVGSLSVSAPVITLFARPGDANRGAAGGGTDDGLNFVAGTSISFGQSNVAYNDTNSNNNVANLVTPSGIVTVNRNQANGVSIFQDQTALVMLRSESGELNRVISGDRFVADLSGDFGTFFQPISGGTQTIDTAAALSGALPDQKPIDVATDITISASQLEELLKLGIHPRKAQKQERISLASKRALFAQLVDGLDKDNYGRLQPIKGGISTLVPSDYVVVVDRMSEGEVRAILTAFEDLYGKNKEKVPPIGEAFNTAFTDYSTEKQTADATGFAPYIAAKPGKYPNVDKAVRGFDNLFGYIEHLGLTDKEQAKAKEHIASDLQVSGVSAEDMVKVIDTLRTKIPKAEKAASTKLPPSAPAGNPAPNATSPGKPEQKKGTPPLKTAEQLSPAPASDAAGPIADNRPVAVAGL